MVYQQRNNPVIKRKMLHNLLTSAEQITTALHGAGLAKL